MRLTSGNALAARIEHPAEPERGQEKGHVECRAEHGVAQIRVRRLDALARPERHVGEGALVGAQRELVLCTAVDVIEDHWRQTTLRHPPQVGDVDDLGKSHARRS
jgi:hypothetical protein